MQEFDKKLSEKIKQTLEGYQPPLQPAHWQAMQAQLAARRRRVGWFRALAAVVLLLVVGGGLGCLWYAPSVLVPEHHKIAEALQERESWRQPSKEQPRHVSDSLLDIEEDVDSTSNTDRATALGGTTSSVLSDMNSAGQSSRNDAVKNRGDSMATGSQKGTLKRSGIAQSNTTARTTTDSKLEKQANASGVYADSTGITPANSAELGQTEQKIMRLPLFPEDSLPYFLWQVESKLPAPIMPASSENTLLRKPTSPGVRFYLGGFGGVSNLRMANTQALGSHVSFSTKVQFTKRFFFEMNLAAQRHVLETEKTAYVPLDWSANDSLTSVPSFDPESAFPSSRQYASHRLAYYMPSAKLTTSLGFNVYQNARFNVFTTLGLTHFIWGAIEISPYGSPIGAVDYISISNSLNDERIVGRYPLTYQAWKHADWMAAWQTQIGVSYAVTPRWEIAWAAWSEQSFEKVSPEKMELRSYGTSFGVYFKLK